MLKSTTVAIMVAALSITAPQVFAADSKSPAKATQKAQVVKTAAQTPVKTHVKTAAKAPAKKAVKTSATARAPGMAYLQCVGYARQATGMQIYGDAWTWWKGAEGKYEKGQSPRPGAVMVFRQQGKMSRGHVAVVSQIITERYIQISHANWSPIGGRRGQIELDVNVMDVSENNDWSVVKVWYGPLNDFGTTTYTTYGFIYDNPTAPSGPRPYTPEAPDFTTGVKVTQAVAVVDSLPNDLETALTPAGNTVRVKPVTVRAKAAGGKSLSAQIEADNVAAAADKPVAAGSKAPN